MRTVAVIQARMARPRCPARSSTTSRVGRSCSGQIDAVRAVPSVDEVVVATTDQPARRPVRRAPRIGRVRVHRGSTHDVLQRVVMPSGRWNPTSSSARPATTVPRSGCHEAQIQRLVEGRFDYVGINGLPLGLGGEASGCGARDRGSGGDRARRARARAPLPVRPTGALPHRSAGRTAELEHPRYTVDTDEDMAFARAIAGRLPANGRASRLADLEAIVGDAPDIAAMNRDVEQRHHRVAELTSPVQERA